MVVKIKKSQSDGEGFGSDNNARMDYRANLQLSPSVAHCDEMSYNIYEVVGDAVDWYRDWAYDSRHHLLRVLRELYEYDNNSIEPTDDISKAIVYEEDEQLYEGIYDVRNELFDDDKWWKRESITFGTIKKYQDKDDKRLKNGQYRERVIALYSAFPSDFVSKSIFRKQLTKAYNIKTQKTLNKYVDKAHEIDDVNLISNISKDDLPDYEGLDPHTQVTVICNYIGDDRLDSKDTIDVLDDSDWESITNRDDLDGYEYVERAAENEEEDFYNAKPHYMNDILYQLSQIDGKLAWDRRNADWLVRD
jgi:hypothetical protein